MQYGHFDFVFNARVIHLRQLTFEHEGHMSAGIGLSVQIPQLRKSSIVVAIKIYRRRYQTTYSLMCDVCGGSLNLLGFPPSGSNG